MSEERQNDEAQEDATEEGGGGTLGTAAKGAAAGAAAGAAVGAAALTGREMLKSRGEDASEGGSDDEEQANED